MKDSQSTCKNRNPRNRGKKGFNPVPRLPGDYPWQVLRACALDLAGACSEDFRTELTEIIRSKDIARYMEFSKAWCLQRINANGLSFYENKAHYQLASLLKKFQFDSDANLRQTSAMKKFIIAEINCNNYNKRGVKVLESSDDNHMADVFLYAKGWIQKVIGFELPDEGKLTLRSRHGPGSSSNTRNGFTSSYFKYSEWPYDCTIRCRDLAISAIKADERWLGALEDSYRRRNGIAMHVIIDQQVFWNDVINIVDGNKIAFVPKSYETDRTIAIEPTLNLYLQLGIDGFIRQRLKRWEIDLDSQLRNREFARLGSLSDDEHSFVTLDLSMASDSISTAICRYLLPTEWYSRLMDLRSPSGRLGKKSFNFSKISSMGNGFTFALESLIFGAICYGVQKSFDLQVPRGAFTVYGDDLIVPKYTASRVVQALRLAGFQLNTEKSFYSGPVRESCGADWFKGLPVRPVCLGKTPTNVKELMSDRNRIVRSLTLRFSNPENVIALYDKWFPDQVKAIRGPLSDEEFDTYIHDPQPLRFRNCMWSFTRLIWIPGTCKGSRVNEFHFRKLMCSLASSPPRFDKWSKDLNAGGNVFEVMHPSGARLASKSSASSIWASEYSEG